MMDGWVAEAGWGLGDFASVGGGGSWVVVQMLGLLAVAYNLKSSYHEIWYGLTVMMRLSRATRCEEK